MRFISHDPHFVRRWAVARGLVPILGPRGALQLAKAEPADGLQPITWEEFAGLFTVEALAFAYDGATAWSIRPALPRRRERP